jgi:hypothetical protein
MSSSMDFPSMFFILEEKWRQKTAAQLFTQKIWLNIQDPVGTKKTLYILVLFFKLVDYLVEKFGICGKSDQETQSHKIMYV